MNHMLRRRYNASGIGLQGVVGRLSSVCYVQAIDTLQIKEKAWAFVQINGMGAWYKHLTDTNLIPAEPKLSVTSYSLGGYLATAFNTMLSVRPSKSSPLPALALARSSRERIYGIKMLQNQ